MIGLVLLFFMLTQYNTWILIGVMQEKSSRVVEVLLATVRPIQLLGGKVLGIGLVALGQATLIVGFALIVASAVGSDLLHGAAPLVLGVRAALARARATPSTAGSTPRPARRPSARTRCRRSPFPSASRSCWATSSPSPWPARATPDLFFKILAYLPPTAPFCMPVLVGLNQVAWWGFVASVLITIAGTVGMAIFAARIYQRAVLAHRWTGETPRPRHSHRPPADHTMNVGVTSQRTAETWHRARPGGSTRTPGGVSVPCRFGPLRRQPS